MLLPNMTDEEIRREIVADKNSLQDKFEVYKKKFRKEVLRSSKYPLMRFYEYKTPRNNTMIISLLVTKRGEYDNPKVSLYSLYRKPNGIHLALWTYPDNVTIFPPHFFKRYRERILKDESLRTERIVRLYLQENWCHLNWEMNKDLDEVYHCLEGHDSNEKIDVVVVSNNGLCFGIKEDKVRIIKTIVSVEMLSERQEPMFEDMKERWVKKIESAYINNNFVKYI